MAERPVFKEMGKDQELQKKLEGNATLSEILDNPHIQEVVTNMDIVNELLAVDIKDLRTYLETGKSPKFAQEKILGRWSYDLNTSLRLTRRAKSDFSVQDWKRIKTEMADRYDGAVFTAFYDNKANLKLSAFAEGKTSPMVGIPRPPNWPANRPYQTNYVAAWLDTNASHSATGEWNGSPGNYTVNLSHKGGKSASQVQMIGDRLMAFEFERRMLVFEPLLD